MSIDNDVPLSITQPEEGNPTSSRQSRMSYTREFLLSLSALEVCKKFPKGFDESLLREFESSLLQGFRHNDYGSSPPGKGETGNFSRWDSRASGRSDTDSQSDRDSDSGKRYSSQFRRPWLNSEHDGLLGSGSFPRPPGYAPSVPGFRANDQQQLNRSNGTYHPPRPYKAPHSRRETKDSYNDETFGWDETTSEDRVEEERKRRAEFEMMRKEQQKELQAKLKTKEMAKLKDDPLTELAASLNTGDGAIMTNGSNTHRQNDSGKSSISSQVHPLRPLVPPGFANAAAEKISGPKSLSHPGQEVEKLESGDCNQDEKSALQQGVGEKDSETKFPLASKDQTKLDLSSAFELSINAKDPVDLSMRASNISEISEVHENGKVMGIDSENATKLKIMGEAGRSASILDKLFEGALSINSSSPSDIIKDHNMNMDDVSSTKNLPVSKFAHLFLEEDKKLMKSGSSEKSNDLLSLIIGERSGLIASETKTTQQVLPLESNSVKLAGATPGDSDMSAALYNEKKPEIVSAVLTCEDLEQSILSKIGESSSCSQPPGIICSQHLESDIPKTDINNNASQHLLSLLQKGIGSNSEAMSPISMLDKGFPKESQDLGGERSIEIQGNIGDQNAENLSSGKGLTLETLFGTAFMKELQSVGAPVSVQRKSAGSSSIDVSEPSMLLHAVSDDEARFNGADKDGSALRLGGAHQTNLEKVGMNWLIVDRLQTKVESNLPNFDVHFPEEDSLTGLSVPVNAQSSMSMAHLGVANVDTFPSSSNTPVNIAEKLAALAAPVKEERPNVHRQDNPPFLRGRFDMVKPEIPYPSMHAQSSPQFNPTPVDHAKPMFHPLDPHTAHVDRQLNFIPPEGANAIHQDGPARHQFPADLGHSPYQHPATGLSEFNHPIHPNRHPMLEQTHMPNNLPLSHLLPGFPGCVPPPPHPGGNPLGYVQEHHLIQGFPFGQRLSNLGMPLPGPEHGSMNNSPPQAFQTLLEMELRSNQKQMHPSFPAGGSHSQPLYGHELDTGLWYR